jgi:hypothetical protein
MFSGCLSSSARPIHRAGRPHTGVQVVRYWAGQQSLSFRVECGLFSHAQTVGEAPSNSEPRSQAPLPIGLATEPSYVVGCYIRDSGFEV